jgi:hypothetical protein
MLSVLLPECRLDPPIGIERSHELVAVFTRSLGEFLRTGKIEPDALEEMR